MAAGWVAPCPAHMAWINSLCRPGPYAGTCVLVDGPEYENAAGLGSNIGNFDAQKVLELNFYCDTYGIDTISVANCIAFAMECYEEGLDHKGAHRRPGTELRQRRCGS